MQQNLHKDYFWNTLGVLLQNAISPILLIAVTRVNGVIDSGLFSYALAVALLFWAVSIWGGRTYQVSDLKKEFSAHSYVTVRIMLASATIVGAILFCLFNSYDVEKSLLILSFIVFKSIESVSDAIYGILQVGNRLYISGRSLTIKAMVGSGLFIGLDIVTGSLLVASVGLIIVNLIIFLLYDLHYARRIGYKVSGIFDRARMHKKEAAIIMRRCSPIAAVIFLSMLSINIPRYFLDIYHPDELGFFGILVMPITVLGLLITFLLQPNIITLSSLFSTKQFDSFLQITKKIAVSIVVLGMLGLLLAIAMGIPILQVVFGVDFESRRASLLLVIVGAIANGIVSLYINTFTIIRHFKALFYTLVFSNVGLILVSIPIIHSYSLVGAIGLFTVVNFVQLGVLVVVNRDLFRRYRAGDLRPIL